MTHWITPFFWCATVDFPLPPQVVHVSCYFQALKYFFDEFHIILTKFISFWCIHHGYTHPPTHSQFPEWPFNPSHSIFKWSTRHMSFGELSIWIISGIFANPIFECLLSRKSEWERDCEEKRERKAKERKNHAPGKKIAPVNLKIDDLRHLISLSINHCNPIPSCLLTTIPFNRTRFIGKYPRKCEWNLLLRRWNRNTHCIEWMGGWTDGATRSWRWIRRSKAIHWIFIWFPFSLSGKRTRWRITNRYCVPPRGRGRERCHATHSHIYTHTHIHSSSADTTAKLVLCWNCFHSNV